MSTTQTLTKDEVSILLDSAVRAPSIHSTRPWRLEINGPVVDVVLDPDRVVPTEDPSARLVRIGLGAATFNLRVAAAMLGHETGMAADPDPARANVVVRLFLGRRQGPVPELGSLYGELRSRQTYRGPMLSTPVPDRVRAVIACAADTEGARLHWLVDDQVARLWQFLRRTDDLELADGGQLGGQLAERWIDGGRAGPDVHGTAPGPIPVRAAMFGDLAPHVGSSSSSKAMFEERPLIAVLATDTDKLSDWLRAGMALQHALLAATSYDVAASLHNQPLNHPELRARVQELIGAHRRPQLVLRVGYPAQAGGEVPRQNRQDSLDQWF